MGVGLGFRGGVVFFSGFEGRPNRETLPIKGRRMREKTELWRERERGGGGAVVRGRKRGRWWEAEISSCSSSAFFFFAAAVGVGVVVSVFRSDERGRGKTCRGVELSAFCLPLSCSRSSLVCCWLCEAEKAFGGDTVASFSIATGNLE
ncbi:unnamed protein product [Victoria cruziana]